MLRASSRLAVARVASVSTRHAALVGVQQRRSLSTEVARLFTPGPLTTSVSVKEAMQKDLGSRAPEMVSTVSEVRQELLAMAHVSQEAGYECVIMQGSGTFAVRAIVQSSHPLRAMTDVTRHAHACSQVESVVTSVVPDSGRLLILSNGAYGKRLALIAERHGIDHGVVSASEREVITPSAVEAELLRAAGAAGERPYSHVVVVHHETTSGVLNPMHEIGLAVGRAAPDAAYKIGRASCRERV